MSEVEFYSYPHVVAIGRRKMLVPLEGGTGKKRKEWEVYVRMVSGSTFLVASGLTRKASGKAMAQVTREMGEQTGSSFVTTPDAAIVFEHIARCYVDTQENEFVTMVEDSSGANYRLDQGSKAKCQGGVELVAHTILQYMAQREGQ